MSQSNITEKQLESIKKSLDSFAKNYQQDAALIEKIRKRITENKKNDFLRDIRLKIENSFETIHEHQRFTSIAINPFIQIQHETAVPNHHLIMLDPFVFLNELPIKTNFDALILSSVNGYNTLIFIETKSADLSIRMLNELTKKIEKYESPTMQETVRNTFPNLKINRIEYVLLVQPHRYDYARKNLKDKMIRIEKSEGNFEEKRIPLILWTINRSIKKHNYYFLLMQPYLDDINEAIKLRQCHLNKELRDFLTVKVEYRISTEIFHTKFSPVLDINYQLLNALVLILKLNESKVFKKNELKNLIKSQLFKNLNTETNIEFIVEKIIKKGLKTKILQTKEEDNEDQTYIIALDKRKQAKLIQNDIMNKICDYKANFFLQHPETKLLINRTILNNFHDSKERKSKIMRDYYS